MSEPEKKKRKKRQAPKVVQANVSNTRYAIVGRCCEEMGYKITESTSKNLLFWCDTGGNFEFASGLYPWQFYNHFPGTWSLARKVDLARNIEKMERLLPEFYNFHPKSFIIPSQTSELQNYLSSIPRKSKRTFIVKPDKGSLGKGILLIQDGAAVDDWYEPAIAQQYIQPYLIDGLKFDLRVYALVSSIEPLRIYVHEEGLARFCTEPYVKPSAANLELSFAHLTNYSLNKNNPNFEQPMDAEHADFGHKRSMSSVFKVMKENGVDIDKLKTEIDDIIRLTLISVQPYIVTSYRTAIPLNDGKSRCFEVLGFDILIDKKAKPWLLEVNWAPSLATDSPFDVAVKSSVLKGALTIINIPANFKRIVMNRRKTVSQQKSAITLWNADEETELAKNTQYRLIYPLDKSHPRFRDTELAFSESKASPVGAAIQPGRAKARKEAMMGQLAPKQSNPAPPPPPHPKPVLLPERKVISPVTKSCSIVSSIPRVSCIVPPIQSGRTAHLVSTSIKKKYIRPPVIVPLKRMSVPVPTAIENTTLFIQFCDLPPELISDFEERERLKMLKKQQNTAQLLLMPERITKMLRSVASHQSKTQQRTAIPVGAMRVETTTLKSGLSYTKFQVPC